MKGDRILKLRNYFTIVLSRAGDTGGAMAPPLFARQNFLKLTFTNKIFNSWECTMGTY